MPKPRTLKPLEDTALTLLARREHSVAELCRKLLQRGYEKVEVEAMLLRLQENRLLSDARYTEVRVRVRAQESKWGKTRIKQELAQAGITADMAATTLAALEETHDWLTMAQTLAQRHFPQPLKRPAGEGPEAFKAYQKEKQRRIGFLVRKGYTLGQALTALNMTDADDEMDGL